MGASLEAINRNNSWEAQAPVGLRGRVPLDPRSPVGTLEPVLWVSEVGKEAIRIVTITNT